MREFELVPTFSLAERDARWARVRALMAEQGLDCLIGYPNQGRFEQLQANTRYLIQIGGFQTEAAVTFPADGEVTAIVQSGRDLAFWEQAQDWIDDIRSCRRIWADAIVARLKELGLSNGRIGVIGLEGLNRAPEGVVPWRMFEKTREALPDIEFVNATPLVLGARAIKSAEELTFIENAERVAEMAAEKLLETARVGVPENVVYAAVVQTMIANGCELPTMIYWGAGQSPTAAHIVPSRRPLQKGDSLDNEIEAKWGGYIAQVSAPAVLGPVPEEEQRLHEAACAIFETMCEAIRPGVTLGDVGKLYRGLVAEVEGEPIGWPFHGRGLGDDLPVMPDASRESEMMFEAGHVLILKPGVAPKGGSETAAKRAGDTVVVEAAGARRLGRRPLAIATLPA